MAQQWAGQVALDRGIEHAGQQPRHQLIGVVDRRRRLDARQARRLEREAGLRRIGGHRRRRLRAVGMRHHIGQHRRPNRRPHAAGSCPRRAGMIGGAETGVGAGVVVAGDDGRRVGLCRLIRHNHADKRLIPLLRFRRVLRLAAGEEEGQQHHDPERDQQPFPPSPDRQRLGLLVLLPCVVGAKLAHRAFACRMSRSNRRRRRPGAGGLAGRVISGVDDVEHIRAEPQPEVRRDLFDHNKITGTMLPGEPFAAVVADDIDRGFLGQPRKPHQGPLPVVHRAAGLDRGRPPALGQVVA